MHALLLVRRSVDEKAMVRIAPDGKRIETQGLKMGINPFDAIACEHAVQLKEQGIITHITVLGIGDEFVQDSLRHAIAMGVDRAIYIESSPPSPLTIAQTTAALAQRENAELLILGAQNPDDMFGQEGSMISALMGWPQVPQYTGNAHCVIATDILLNTPRRVLLPQIIAARNRQIDRLSLEDLGIIADLSVEITHFDYPAPRAPVTMLDTLDDLISAIEKTIR